MSLMPGNWWPGHITRLCKEIGRSYERVTQYSIAPPTKPMASRKPMYYIGEMSSDRANVVSRDGWQLELVTTMTSEVECLQPFVDWTLIKRAFDPWAGVGSIARAMLNVEIHMASNDMNPELWWKSKRDSLMPSTYKALEMWDCIITSPWFKVLDLAVPLAASAVRQVACIHVPGHYFTNMPPAREQYFRQLAIDDRLHVIGQLPNGPLGRRCLWLLIFKTSQWKQALLILDAAGQRHSHVQYSFASLTDSTGTQVLWGDSERSVASAQQWQDALS